MLVVGYIYHQKKRQKFWVAKTKEILLAILSQYIIAMK